MNKELLEEIHNRPHFHKHIECLDKHLNEYFKNAEITVFHEMLSLDFHLDVYFISRKEDNFNMLITLGMSLLEMTVPNDLENREDYTFAELMVLVPKDLKFEKVHTGEDENGWIISMLKEAARFPHHYNTWIGIGHTLQATYDMKPYSEETDFVGCAVLPSVTFGDDFTEFYCGEQKINIYSLLPLYKNELAFKIENGYNKFLDKLIEANAQEIINPARENLIL